AGVTGVNTYSWSGAPAVPGAKTVNATNNAGLASATATFTPTADGTAPAGGSVSYLNGNTTGTSVAVTFATGTDGGSGLNTAASVLQRARAPLTNGVCGTYDTFATIAANPTSPYTDTAVSGGFCYQYQYLAFDNVGNPATYTSASVSKLDYAAAVAATAGGVGHWRLGESTVSDDTFTGTAGVSVTSRTGEVGATWNQWQGTVAAVLSNEGRLRRDATTGSSHLSSAVPPTADYQVSADVHVKSLLTDDYAGVMGRLDTASNVTNGTRYLARYNVNSTRWELNRDASVNATLGTSVATLVAGQTYRLTLDMVGTRIRLLVNGVELIAATDAAPITGIGRAGIRLAQNSASVAVPSNTAGLHLDNYRVTPMTVKDSKGTNDGTYVNNPTLGAAGALAGDTDTAVTLNGTTHHMSIPHATALNVGDNFSFEAWVKRADNDPVVQTIAHKSGAFHLVFLDNKFAFFRDGAELISTATITPTDTTTFHHYVATKNGNAVKLYIDGVDVTGTPAVATIANSTNPLSLGAKFATSASEFLKGTLDEVALYGGVLSAATVADHYNLGRSDVSGPTGGSVDAIGLIGTASRYSTTTSLSIALAKGTDTRSGLAFAGAQLRRSTATLTAGTCGTYNTSVQVGADDPTSPVADTVPAGQACYRYEYVVADGVGNTTTYLSGDIKVDTTAPSAPALGFTSLTNAYWPGTGTTVYYRPAATTGSFTATATATDTNSGIAGYTMPTLGTGWTTPSGTTGVQTYAW
ncbi:MAG TPA: LamG domain-containing protein, partial [Catenuloplanes sp.]